MMKTVSLPAETTKESPTPGATWEFLDRTGWKRNRKVGEEKKNTPVAQPVFDGLRFFVPRF